MKKNNFNKWLISTLSFFKNYRSDFEHAYEEGFGHGYEEGLTEGFFHGKTEQTKLWNSLYDFLQERQLIDPHEVVSSFDMMERLYSYENDLKNAGNSNSM